MKFDILTVGNLQNIFMEHDLNIQIIFGIKERSIILTHTMYFSLFATNAPQRLKTAFVLQSHICDIRQIILHAEEEGGNGHRITGLW